MGNVISLLFSKTPENHIQSSDVQVDYGNDRRPDCEDRITAKIKASYKTIPKQSADQVDKGQTRKIELFYNMNHKNRGLALVFNHEKYDIDVDARTGTHVDRDRLRETLCLLDFDVRVYEDLKLNKILTILEEVAKMDHSDNDCLVVVFLTHGKLKDFNDTDSCNTLLNHDLMSYVYARNEKYPLQDVWYYFTNEVCPSLANKPRIFLIQACQGEKRERAFQFRAGICALKSKKVALRTANLSFLPKQDFLVAYSSLPGFGSFRHPKEGTWFIQSFCDEMNKRESTDDLLATLTRVIQKVAYDYETESSNPNLNEKKQTPFIVSRLTKLVIFSKKVTSKDKPGTSSI